jgi:hypothetical protein
MWDPPFAAVRCLVIASVNMRRRILTSLGTALLATAISTDAFAQRGRSSNGGGSSPANGNTGGGSVAAVPEIAIASGASALALLAGGLLVLRDRRRHRTATGSNAPLARFKRHPPPFQP